MKKGLVQAILAYVLWGILPAYWKLLANLPPVYILSTRIVWSLVFCLIIVASMRMLPDLKALVKDKRRLLYTALAGVFITVNWLVFIWAVNSGHVIESSMGYFINPLMVVMISVVFFKEKLTQLEIVSLVLAFAGVMIMVIQFGSFPYISLVLAVSFAVYGAIKKKAGIDPNLSLTLETAVVFPVSLGLLIYYEAVGNGAIGSMSPLQLILLPLAGVVTAIPLLLYGYGVKHLSLSVVGFCQYIAPSLMLFLGVFAYGEKFTLQHLITFSFIWLALVIFLLSKFRIRLSGRTGASTVSEKAVADE